MNFNKIIKNIFFLLVCLSVSSALWVFKDLLFPFVTSKAFFFRICIEVALPFYLYLIISEKDLRPSLKNPLSILVLVFFVLNIISSFSGNNTTRSLWGNFERMGGAYYIGHLSALYFYVLLLGQMQKSYLQNFLKFFLFFAFVVAGNGIFGWLGLPTFVVDPSLPTRVSSTLGNPIYLGSFLIVPLFLSLFLGFQSESKSSKITYWLLSVIFIFGIFLSGTRGAVVGLILGTFISALIYIIFSNNKKIKVYGASLVLVFIGVVAMLFIFKEHLPSGSVLQRLVRLKDGNSDARLLQWKVALVGFKDRPILGTGPENYYVVANKYYNSEIYKYDRSWFDKPHNYILEILVTSGILGFTAYLATLVLIVYALYIAYKKEYFGLIEFCILFAAFIVYQIQNLFVFDTVPASLTFYSYLGFVGYLLHISKAELVSKEATKKYIKPIQAFPVAVFVVSLIVASYAVYASNIVPMQVAKNVNYGFAYAGVDPKKASAYFDIATTLPFNFDSSETASKYADFVSNMVRAVNSETKDLAVENLNKAINYMEYAIEVQPDNPILWQRIVTLYLYKASQSSGQVVDSRVEDAVNKAVLLAPNREESYLNRVQILAVKGDLESAINLLKKTKEIFPTDLNLNVQISNYYKFLGNQEEALKYAEEALASGYNYASYGEMKWLVDYYVKNQELEKGLILLQSATKIEPNNIQVFIDTANLYFMTGKINEAQKLAKQIINFDPTKQKELQAIVNTYSKVATSTP